MKILIVTNDFPPRSGGIQAFVHSLASRLAPGSVVVYAPSWDGAPAFDAAQPFPVIRHRSSLMLPVRSVARTAAGLVEQHRCDTVLFGAAAPLGLLAPALRRAGAERLVALTHGHEAGWAAVPGARQLLRRIGDRVDVVTYLGEYFRLRLAWALSAPAAARMVRLAPGVDTDVFRPGAGGARIRELVGIAPDRPVALCVSRMVPRKGQDTLIRAWPKVLDAMPAAAGSPPAGSPAAAGTDPLLLFAGDGPYLPELRRLAQRLGVSGSVHFAGPVAWGELPAYYDAANVFAMPCRTRRGGLDVEGLGIVYLEAAASGLPVIGGDSGGAPDAIRPGDTGYVVPGRGVAELAARLTELLVDGRAAAAMGERGRAWMQREWRWDLVAERLTAILAGRQVPGGATSGRVHGPA